MHEAILMSTVQSGILFLLVWFIFRLVPSIPANVRAWVWRIAILKPLLGLLPLAVVPLRVIPAAASEIAPVVATPGSGVSGAQISYQTMEIEDSQEVGIALDPWLAVWLTGAAAVCIYGLQGRQRVGQIAARSAAVQDPQLLQVLGELLSASGANLPVRLMRSTEVQTAMLLGGREPLIVLPDSAMGKGSFGDARLMLAHEVAHLVRRDLSWLGVVWTVQSLFFFNPLVWLAARCALDDHESATDAYAIKLVNVTPQAYAEMLLRTSVASRPTMTLGAALMSGSYRSVQRRLESMKHFRSNSCRWRKPALGALAIVISCSMPAYRLAEAAEYRPPHQTLGTNWVENRYPAVPDNVSFKFENCDVREALRLLFQRMGKSFEIAPLVQGTVTVSCENVTLNTALQNITRQVDAHYVIESGRYVIEPGVSMIVPGALTTPGRTDKIARASTPIRYPDVRLTFKYEKADVREVLRSIFRKAVRSYSIDVMVQGTVTVVVKNKPFDDALREVLGKVNGTFKIKDGVYVVTPRGRAGRR